MVIVTLAPFTADLLPVVQPWFRHPEVARRLGGPEWPARELRLLDSGIGEMFRGRRVLRTHSWVAFDAAGDAVAKVGGEVYDRWCRYTETPEGSLVDAVEPGPAMGLAYVVDPRRWRRGHGTAALLAAMDAPEVADVVLFAAGIEPDNVASARCAASAGMAPDTSAPDWEGMIHHVRRRAAGGSGFPTAVPSERGEVMTERVRAELRQSGGFAGRTVHVQADSARMAPADAARLVQLVSSIDLSRLAGARPPLPAGADLMSYDLTIERGGNRWHGTVADPAIPSELRPLLQFLTNLAR